MASRSLIWALNCLELRDSKCKLNKLRDFNVLKVQFRPQHVAFSSAFLPYHFSRLFKTVRCCAAQLLHCILDEIIVVLALKHGCLGCASSRGVGPDGKPQSKDVWTRDVLNCGVRPDLLIARMRSKLEALGGKVYELAALQGREVLLTFMGLLIAQMNGTNRC
eukprot:scaffold227950_cov19-Tisochrysis_lutea.AAC.1